MTIYEVVPRRLTCVALVAIVLGISGNVSAEVASVAADGFAVKHEVAIKAAPSAVYDAMTAKVGSWWNPVHTFSHDAKNLSIAAKAGGCFCETLPNGGGVEHMKVVFVMPGKMLRMSGALGPLQAAGLAGSMTWTLSESAEGTRLVFSYVVGGYMPGGFEKMAPIVDAVLGEQVARLRTFVETGRPPVAAGAFDR
jgi:uncharacterized protein YndB with AHSA1/START domain